MTRSFADLTATGPFELVEDASQGYPLRVYKNAPASLREVLMSTRRIGERPFLIYEDEVTTYGQHFGQVAALAQRLRAAGVGKGDRVAIGMRNYPEWSISLVGLPRHRRDRGRAERLVDRRPRWSSR